MAHLQGGGETEGVGETAERAGETGEREEGSGGFRDEEKGQGTQSLCITQEMKRSPENCNSPKL